MSVLLYCFCKGNSLDFNQTGIAGKPVKQVSTTDITAVYSEHSQNISIEPSSSDLAQHPAVLFQQVVQKVHQRYTSIPVRFPTLLNSTQDLTQIIENHAFELHKQLNTKGNAIEYSIRALIRESKGLIGTSTFPKNLANSPGVNYLKDREAKFKSVLQQESHAQALERDVQALFRSDISDLKVQVTGEIIRLHLLGPKEWMPNPNSIELLKASFPNFEIYLSGPFPPFHFVNVKLSATTS